MYDNMSEAAGRVVDQLSRRRFVGWLGKGGLALAGGLCLHKLSARALGQATPCEQIQLPKHTLTKGQEIEYSFCTTGGHPGAREASHQLCLHEDQTSCDGRPCNTAHGCFALNTSLDNVHIDCRKAPKADQDCNPGQTKYTCTARGGKNGTFTCHCTCL